MSSPAADMPELNNITKIISALKIKIKLYNFYILLALFRLNT